MTKSLRKMQYCKYQMGVHLNFLGGAVEMNDIHLQREKRDAEQAPFPYYSHVFLWCENDRKGKNIIIEVKL